MKYSFIIYLLLIATGFSACTSSQKKSGQLVSNIRTNLKRNYGVNDGEIMAKFNIIESGKKETLFSNLYGPSVNSVEKNQQFLKDFSNTYRNNKYNINEVALKKLIQLSTLLSNLNDQFKILPTSIVHQVSKFNTSKYNKKLSTNYYTLLTHLHNHTKLLPLYPPLSSPKITSKFGPRIHPIKKVTKSHNGIDLAGHKQCQIFAAGDGIVEIVGRSHTYGNMILISHNKQIKSRYAHLSKISVKQGEKIIMGQGIGNQGCSGTSRGEHLHFEIIIKEKPVNPALFLKNSL